MSRLDHLWAGWRTEYITSTAAAADRAPADRAPDDRAPDDQAPDDQAPDDQAPDDRAPSAREASARCVFCRILASGLPDAETNVVWRHPGGEVVALLNAYPYATGHLMVMPVRHAADLETLGGSESAALWAGVTDAVRAVKAAYRPEGLNVGANLGRAAGAGIPGHLHVHVLPRWGGDSNFMTSIAETRVLPEALSSTAGKLRAAWPG